MSAYIAPPAALPPHVRLVLEAWWDDRQDEISDGFFIGFPAARAWYDAMAAYLEEGPMASIEIPVSFSAFGDAQRYWFDRHHRAPRPVHGSHVRIMSRKDRYFIAQAVGGSLLLLTLGEGAKLSWQPEITEVTHG